MDERNVKGVVIGIIFLSLVASLVTGVGIIFSGTVTCFILMSPFGVAWYIHKASDIQRLREKIRHYNPGRWTMRDVSDEFKGPSKIRLGVYGVQGAGKSALLNSLHFAFKGCWQYFYVEKASTSDRGETLFRDPVMLTDHITTFDTRGLTDFSVSKVNDVIDEISGQRGIDTRSQREGEKIDCPIFVFGYSNTTEIRHCHDFLVSFLPRIRNLLGAYPIMVITFADSIPDRESILRNLITAGMDKSSVFFIENYTEENHEMDKERHVILLKILEACILRADDNVTFKWRKEREDENTPNWFVRFFRKILKIFKRGN